MEAFVNSQPLSSGNQLRSPTHSSSSQVCRRRPHRVCTKRSSRFHPCATAASSMDAGMSPANSNELEKRQGELVGWEKIRLNLSSLKIEKTPETSKLPGTHFTNPPEITALDLMQVLRQETPDAYVNEMVRTLLGWFQKDDGTWDTSNASRLWLKYYPDSPPDFIGQDGNYEPKFDMPIKLAVQRLSRSIPDPYKQSLKPAMGPFGFKGLKVNELTPNKTRRCQVVNYIIYWYRVHYPDFQWK